MLGFGIPDRRRRGIAGRSGLVDLVRSDKLLFQQRLYPVKIALVVSGLGFQSGNLCICGGLLMFHLGDFGGCGTNLSLVGFDLLFCQLMPGFGLGKFGLVGSGIDHIE